MIFKIGNVKVETSIEDMTEEEAARYVEYVEAHKPTDDPLESITVTMCNDGKIDVDYTLHGRKFERIRRITGKGIAVHNQAA